MKLDLGQRIRELRRRHGRTQEALAEALGVTSQAVSRWESGGSYPDIETVPSIANYFGISIDELFGYVNDREKRIDDAVSFINRMNSENNGKDVSIDDCIMRARELNVEFPGNGRAMLCLASVLYNAGYVRYGEYHLTDGEGYSVYDTERHRTYIEWREAISLYEKLLITLGESEERHRVVKELTQLYLNTGEHERALALAESAPTLYGSREFLRIKACDGKKQAEAYGDAILKSVRACSELMIGCALSYESNMTCEEKADCIRGAISLFDCVCEDNIYGIHSAFVAREYTLLSLFLWLGGKRDEAFDALDLSAKYFTAFLEFCKSERKGYSSPCLRLVKEKTADISALQSFCLSSLADDWPWWRVDGDERVKKEMQADPRWQEWLEKLT